MLNRDRLNNADQQQSAIAAMTVVDRLQNFAPDEQLVGAAAVFLMLAEHYGVSAQDAFTVTKNVINDTDRKLIPEFRAVRQYIQEEL
jgi:site-specific DNA-adenine methylase